MRRIEVYDTTLRDGAQTEGITFTLKDKLRITKRLDAMGFDYVEGGYPASNDKDEQYFQEAADLVMKHAKICAFGMTRRKGARVDQDGGITALVASGAPVITVVGKSSAYQATEVIRASLEENLAMISETISWLVSQGRTVFYDAEHFFDGFRRNPGYTLQTLNVAAQAGAASLNLCDTNGGSMPEEIVAGVSAALGVCDSIPIGIHAHNDCGLAVANSLAAVDAGASIVQGTINGFGERCGNADLVVIIANLLLKKRDTYDALIPGALEDLTDLSRYVFELLNLPPSNRQPFVGRSAFAHKGGMHVSGIHRDTCAYEHIDPAKVGNERRILVSELSGRANIIARTAKYKIADNSELLAKILEAVVHKENEGYQYEAAEGSFDLLVRKTASLYHPHFERINYQTNVIANDSGVLETVATVKLRIGGIVRHEVAEGDGPVDALNAALLKALCPLFPCLKEMALVDYKVRILNSDAGTAASIRVIIESRDQNEEWGTVGVNENVIEASWIALIDSIEYKLAKTGV